MLCKGEGWQAPRGIGRTAASILKERRGRGVGTKGKPLVALGDGQREGKPSPSVCVPKQKGGQGGTLDRAHQVHGAHLQRARTDVIPLPRPLQQSALGSWDNTMRGAAEKKERCKRAPYAYSRS